MRGIAATGSNARCARRAPPPLPSRPSHARQPCQAERFGRPTITGARVPCRCPSGGAHGRDPRDRAARLLAALRASWRSDRVWMSGVRALDGSKDVSSAHPDVRAFFVYPSAQ